MNITKFFQVLFFAVGAAIPFTEALQAATPGEGKEEKQHPSHNTAAIDEELANLLAIEGNEVPCIDDLKRQPVSAQSLQRGSVSSSSSSSHGIPLHVAAFQGNADCVRALIAAGADVNFQNEWGRVALHVAAYNGHADCVRALIDAGAGVNLQNKYGEAALHAASLSAKLTIDAGHLRCLKNCIKLLLSAGAVGDLGPVTDALNQALVVKLQAIVDECARELQADIMKKQQDVLDRMRTVPELEHFPRELLSLIVSFEGFSIDPETPVAPVAPATSNASSTAASSLSSTGTPNSSHARKCIIQ